MTITRLIITSLFLLSFCDYTNSQVVYVGFDNCEISDNGSLGSEITVSGNIGCTCGLVGESLDFNGIDAGLTFDSKVNPVFNDDFTIDFYFSPYSSSDITDIVSFSKDCLVDSFFTLQYLPSINTIRFAARENVQHNVLLDVALDPDKCWHHVALIRNSFTYSIFLNGRIAGSVDARKLYTYSPSGRLTISNNPCTLSGLANHHRFRGFIDEFRIYNYALNEIDLRNAEIVSDKIINRDTTIFLGDNIAIEMGNTCADYFNWTGQQDMDDPESLTPVITPAESRIYYIYFVMKGKTCSDSIKIFIQDPAQLECGNLLLPNSFSPNSDGINDRFGISNSFIIEEMRSFEIFNRLGTRVFQAYDKNDSWDGFYKGNILNPDKYIYRVRYTCRGKEYNVQGVLNLLR